MQILPFCVKNGQVYYRCNGVSLVFQWLWVPRGCSTRTGQGKCQLGGSVFVFVTSLSGAQGALVLRNSALSSSGSHSWLPACPGNDVVPAQQWFHGNGEAKKVSHEHHSSETHTFASMTLQPNISSTTFHY